MSEPSPQGPAVPTEKKGLSKVLSRMRTVLRRDRGSRRLSAQPAVAGSSSAAPSAAAGARQDASSAPLSPAPEPAASQPRAAPEPERTGPEPKRIPRAQIYEERAQKMAERYGIAIDQSDWHHVTGYALRIEKPIRMRVRRYCHVCNQAFGPERQCLNCKHEKCKDCAQYPPRLSETEREDLRRRRAALVQKQQENAPIVPDYDGSPAEFVLKRRLQTDKRDHVMRKPRQRVRRTCHQCNTLFATGRKCEECGHVRCTDCPRDPAKKDRYPYGYPGDEFGPNAVPHFTCHECNTTYPPNPESGTECSNCGHPKCESCPRIKPRKVPKEEPEPDPEIWARVQERLKELNISGPPS